MTCRDLHQRIDLMRANVGRMRALVVTFTSVSHLADSERMGIRESDDEANAEAAAVELENSRRLLAESHEQLQSALLEQEQWKREAQELRQRVRDIRLAATDETTRSTGQLHAKLQAALLDAEQAHRDAEELREQVHDSLARIKESDEKRRTAEQRAANEQARRARLEGQIEEMKARIELLQGDLTATTDKLERSEKLAEHLRDRISQLRGGKTR